MGRILSIEDFATGETRIPLNPNQEIQLNYLIKTVEDGYLNKLFGVDLCALFFTDLGTGNVPTTPRFEIVFLPFQKMVNSWYVDSKGIKEMLKNIVYFYYSRDMISKLTTVDISESIAENRTNVSLNSNRVVEKYNLGIDILKSIQFYIKNNPIDYPEYCGIEVSFCGLL